MDGAIQQYVESSQQPANQNDAPQKCTALGTSYGVPEEAAPKCSGVKWQHRPDSATLVAEGPRGYQCDFPNPYGQLSTPWRASGYDSSKKRNLQEMAVDGNFYTADHRFDMSPMKGIKKEVEVEGVGHGGSKLAGHKVEKRNLRYWERKGLPSEGILLNKKMLLCILTPDKVLWKYFTKVQGALHPDLDMEEGMRNSMSALYQKIFERELSSIDGKVSMKFGRAFLAQELKGKRFNWAQYALSEHIRISERNAKKALRRRYSRQLEDSDQEDEDATHGHPMEDDDDVKYQPAPSRRVMEVDRTRDESEGPALLQAGHGNNNNNNSSSHGQYQLAMPYPTMPTAPETQASLQSAVDVDLQALRADLKRRLMQTHVMQETLGEFDTHILRFVSDKCLQKQEKEDLNWALALVEHKCKLLESHIYFVVGRTEMEKGCVEDGHNKLQDVIARKPTDPERDYPAWKRWCIDLQQHYTYLGYSKHELVEQESALRKLQSEYDAATAERRSLFKKLLQLDDNNTPESNAESDEDPSKGLKRRRLRL